jgi:uracil-DNA glycosylase
MEKLPQGWIEKLAPLKKEPFFLKLQQFLDTEFKNGKTIYPEKKNIFRALEALDLPNVKVVIFGQDPYHGPEQAIGLSFAVPNSLKKKPPSLKNIFKELESDLGVSIDPTQSDLSGWVEQGVLLLNRVLTVEASEPLSHREKGWEEFTDRVVSILSERKQPIVFILWGSHAQKLKSLIDLDRHLVIETPHPSPLSSYRGFFGSKVFSRTNELLVQLGQSPIVWDRISSQG